MRLLLLSDALLLGIWLGSEGGLLWLAAVPVALLGAGLGARVKAWWLGLALALFFAGWLRAAWAPPSPTDLMAPLHGQPLTVRGVVASDPEPREKTTHFRLDAHEAATKGGESQPISGALLVSAPRYPGFAGREFPYYRYGDLLEIEGTPEPPGVLEDFDFKDYLARRGIFTVVEFPQDVRLLAGGQGPRLQQTLYSLRSRLSQGLSLPEPQGSLARGILLGLRGEIPPEVTAAFNRTGASHVIAISGQNLTILLGLATVALAAVWGRHRPIPFYLALVALWSYALLVGMAAPVTRAAIMGSLWLLADFVGRPRAAGPALLLAAAVMAGIDPAVLSDISFQLSFAAMAGLALLAPPLQAWGRRIAPGNGIAVFLVDAIVITLAATITTAPLIAYYFQRLSLVGVPTTLLALPALPGIIAASAVSSVLGVLWAPLGAVTGWVAWLFLTWLLEVVYFFDGLPLASWAFPFRSQALLWAYYGLVGLALLPWQRFGWQGAWERVKQLSQGVKALPARWLLLPLALAAAIVWAAAFSVPDSRLHVWVLDVGQGDAILLRTPSGRQVLIDGGPSPQRIVAELGPRLPFWDRSLDLMVATHPHEDHFAGLVEVARRYRVARVLESGPDSGTLYREWEKLLAQKGVARDLAQDGQTVQLDDDVVLEVLHPPAQRLEGTGDDPDNNSLVLRLRAGDVSFLLTGDLGTPGEDYLLARGEDLRASVLKVAHHGSDTSTSPRFLEAVSPSVAAISAGQDNPFGHPDPEVAARLEARVGKQRVYLTRDRGTVEFITDGKRLWVKTER